MSEEADYRKLYEQEKKSVAALEQRLQLYEQDGLAKLYYSLNRKSSEMADLLNKTKLADLDLDSKESKAFERMRTIWQDAEKISAALAELKILAKISGDEVRDTERKPFIENKALTRN
jgi:hypothetical protein